MRVETSDAVLERLGESPPTMGLLLGQISSDCFDVIYLARTPDDKNQLPQQGDDEEKAPGKKLSAFDAISEASVCDHAKYVTRMLPGGTYVLGIFVVCDDDVFNDKTLSAKLKSILSHTNKILSSNKYIYGAPADCNDRLVLAYSKGRASCKTIDVVSASQWRPVDVTFQLNLKTWQQLDCYHEFDEIYPVVIKKTSSVSVRDQFQQILEAAHQSTESSLVFMNGKLRNESDTLESLYKKKKGKSAKDDDSLPDPIQVSVLLPCESKIADTVEYLECEGTTHFSGVVASTVYLSSRATVKNAIAAVKQDVMRSLASRFIMHCDALISDSLLPEEKICFNEPPRRVLIRLPLLKSGNIHFCDYLFPGESPGEALSSVKEMLDADITEDDVISNVETPADTSEFDAIEKNPTTEESTTTPRDGSRTMYLLMIGIGLLVAVIAVIMQFVLR